MADQTAPSPTLLIKLLKMTTSSNDAEALVAMRKANAEAAKFGGWDAVMAGKITVIGDPFANVATPIRRTEAPAPPPPPAHTPPRRAPSANQGPPPPTWSPRQSPPNVSAPHSSFPVNPHPGDLHTWAGDRWVYHFKRGWIIIGSASLQPKPRRGTVKIDDLV